MVKAEIFGPHNYDSCANRVKKLTGILLIFHPGCGHCVQMRPEWEEMKRRLSPDTKVVEIDGSEMSGHSTMNHSPIVQRTQGFPSIFRVKNGKVAEEYKGPRMAEEMRKFSDKKTKGKKSKKSKKPVSKTRRRKLI